MMHLHAYTRNRKRLDQEPDGWKDGPTGFENFRSSWLEEGGWNCSSYEIGGYRYHRRQRQVFGQHPNTLTEWYLVLDGNGGSA